MYTSYIGKRFLKWYNERNGTNLTAEQYFNEIHFPLFYDNNRYLHSPGNTELFQLITRHKQSDPAERQQAREKIAKKN